MKFSSTLLAQTSGSVGGSTFARNRYGKYIRDRATPVNPQSPQQVAVRTIFAQLTNLWQNTLTQAQRDAWDTYAGNVAMLDALGETIFPTGINHYVRSNVPRVQAGLARVDDGPTVFDLGDFTPASVNVLTVAGATTDSIVFDNTDAWANEDGAAMLVYGSNVLAPTINFFKGPFRFADTIDGDSSTPPTSPAGITSPFVIAVDSAQYVRVRVTRADGRLSTAQILRGIAASV